MAPHHKGHARPGHGDDGSSDEDDGIQFVEARLANGGFSRAKREPGVVDTFDDLFGDGDDGDFEPKSKGGGIWKGKGKAKVKARPSLKARGSEVRDKAKIKPVSKAESSSSAAAASATAASVSYPTPTMKPKSRLKVATKLPASSPAPPSSSSNLLRVNNNIPLFEPGPSDSEVDQGMEEGESEMDDFAQEVASEEEEEVVEVRPKAKKRGQGMLCVEMPWFPWEVLDQYKLWEPRGPEGAREEDEEEMEADEPSAELVEPASDERSEVAAVEAGEEAADVRMDQEVADEPDQEVPEDEVSTAPGSGSGSPEVREAQFLSALAREFESKQAKAATASSVGVDEGPPYEADARKSDLPQASSDNDEMDLGDLNEDDIDAHMPPFQNDLVEPELIPLASSPPRILSPSTSQAATSPLKPTHRHDPDDSTSSIDPIAQDWQSAAAPSEAHYPADAEEVASEYDEDMIEEDEAADDEDESEYEKEDGVPLQTRQNARTTEERREASKISLKLRLRGNEPTSGNLTVSTRNTSRSSLNPSEVSESSISTRMTRSAVPQKRKHGQVSNGDSEPGSSSSPAVDNEGEDELDELDQIDADEIGSDDFQIEPEGRQPKKGGKGRASQNARGGGRRQRKETTEEEESEEEEEEEDILGRHKEFCEKCKLGPADELLAAALKKNKKGGRRKKRHEDEVSEDEAAEMLEGWLECESCVTSWHWGCLGALQQADALQYLAAIEGPPVEGTKKRKTVRIDESVMFKCRKCLKMPNCMICQQADLPREEVVGADGDIVMGNGENPSTPTPAGPSVVGPDLQNGVEAPVEQHLKFRCTRCTQSAHYEHLPSPFITGPGIEPTLPQIAEYYQHPEARHLEVWTCHQCRDWVWKVDMVLAWRPLPADVKEADLGGQSLWTADLPREYLVKFVDRGFRHVTWVPHAWIKSMSPQRLKNFLEKGPVLNVVTDDTLAAKGDEMATPTIANVMSQSQQEEEILGTPVKRRGHHHSGSLDVGYKKKEVWRGEGPPPDQNAESGLPVAWSTIDRVLDIYLLPPPPRKKKGRGKKAKTSRIESDSEADMPTFQGMDGVEPIMEEKVSIDEWERLAGRQLEPDDTDMIAGMVTWLFAKWDDLQYDQSTWDTPPPLTSELYPAYKRALRRYLGARNISIPILTETQCKKRDLVRLQDVDPPKSQPDCVVGGNLFPFQLEGLQWLLTKYYKRDSAILADDMGLGKTVQIASLLGYLGSEEIFPCLVVVPNSTITNWVREFEKWVPHMRVVPYYGEASSRKVIRDYELYHKGRVGRPEGLKAHIVLTTYDMIVSSKEFNIFKAIPRWEVLCVDEGQRLKSDSSLIFSNLKKLNSVHRLLLTGTPLNNNIRELFNLLNFLDPNNFKDRNDLEKKFEQDKLNEDLVRELHALAQPYILRRIKDDVLRLPPKVEIIVPISLTKMQVEVYKLILETNAERIQSAMAERKKRALREGRLQPKITGGEVVVTEAAKEVVEAVGKEDGGMTEAVVPENGAGESVIVAATAAEAMGQEMVQPLASGADGVQAG